MGNAKNKSEFITELFLYYKPFLSKDKQIKLLSGWVDSCLDSEEYEMVNTLKSLITDVEGSVVGDNVDSNVIVIPEHVELVYDEKFVNGALPKITSKKDKKGHKMDKKSIKTPKKRLGWVNIWNKTYGFTIIEFQFSIKNGTFRFIIINYGVDYS